MLTLRKIGDASAAVKYFLGEQTTQVAGAVGYYQQPNELTGQWLAGAQRAFGLGEVVTQETLMRALLGQHPVTGQPGRQLQRTEGQSPRVGVDMTLAPPKSASALMALGEPFAAAVLAAQDASRTAAIHYLEANCARARKGRGGKEQFTAEILIASFRHFTARPEAEGAFPNPHLHDHLIVPNLALRADGKLVSLDMHELYLHQRTAGAVADAAFREALTASLGVSWQRGKEGAWEVVGVPTALTSLWSARHRQLKERLHELGGTAADHDLEERAFAETRHSKESANHLALAELQPSWQVQAATLTITAASITDELRKARPERQLSAAQVQALSEALEHDRELKHATYTARRIAPGATTGALVGAVGRAARINAINAIAPGLYKQIFESPADLIGTITPELAIRAIHETSSTFTRRKLLQVLVDGATLDLGLFDGKAVQAFLAPLPLAEAEAAVDEFLAGATYYTVGTELESGASLLRLAETTGRDISPDGHTTPTHQQAVYTTQAILAQEQEVVALARSGVAAGTAAVDREVAERVIAERWNRLNPGQYAAVVAITTSGSALSTINGAAGTGKTFALAAARDVWAAAGYNLIGCAIGARQAHGLETDAGFPAFTVANLLQQYQSREWVPDSKTVIIMDEAGQADTPALFRLSKIAERAGAKLVLVGDAKQLSAVGAGGLFAYLTQADPPYLSKLEEVVRQKNAWEKAALQAWHEDAGYAARIVHEWNERGRLHFALETEALRSAMLGQYFFATDRHQSAVLLAQSRQEVRELNARAYALALADGRLGGVAYSDGEHTFREGEPVLARHNAKAYHGIKNGQLGYVVGQRYDLTLAKVYVPPGGYTTAWVDDALGPDDLYVAEQRQKIDLLVSRSATMAQRAESTSAAIEAASTEHDTDTPDPHLARNAANLARQREAAERYAARAAKASAALSAYLDGGWQAPHAPIKITRPDGTTVRGRLTERVQHETGLVIRPEGFESLTVPVGEISLSATYRRQLERRLAATQDAAEAIFIEQELAVADLVVGSRVAFTDSAGNLREGVIRAFGETGQAVVDAERLDRIVVPAAYVSRWVEQGYASTLARAQGMTCDVSLALVDGLDANAAYVAATRGRWDNQLYKTAPVILGATAEQRQQEAYTELVNSLGKFTAEATAVETAEALPEGLVALLDERRRLRDILDSLPESRRGERQLLEAKVADALEHVLAAGTDRALAQAWHERAGSYQAALSEFSDREYEAALHTHWAEIDRLRKVELALRDAVRLELGIHAWRASITPEALEARERRDKLAEDLGVKLLVATQVKSEGRALALAMASPEEARATIINEPRERLLSWPPEKLTPELLLAIEDARRYYGQILPPYPTDAGTAVRQQWEAAALEDLELRWRTGEFHPETLHDRVISPGQAHL